MRMTLVSLAALAALSAFAAAQDAPAADAWPQLQHDAGRTGYTDAAVAFDRGRKGGPRVLDNAWSWEKPAEISPLVQPVVAGGLVYVGDYDGVLHAIDAKTGQTRWTYRTGGLIYHTACVYDGRVYSGSQDGALHAVDARTGERRWTFQTRAGIVSAPCAIDGKVLVTSKDGHLYAVDAASGELAWQFPAAGEPALAPILCSPSAGGGVACFGDESLMAYGVDLASGRLKWKQQLRGQSFMYYWPVVGAETGIAVLRTQPIYSFHDNLNRGDAWMSQRVGQTRDEHNAARDAAAATWAEQHREDVRREQEAIREYLRERPWEQTCFVLDLQTGQEKYVPPVFYTGGGGYTPAPPVLDDAGGRGWMVFRSGYSMTDGGYMVRGWTDVGEWDPATGNIRQITQTKQGWETYHLIGDETILLSANRDLLFLNSWPNHGAIGLEGHDSYNVTRDAEVGHDRDRLWAVNAGSAAGNGGGHGDSTIVTAEGQIFWNAARYIRSNRPVEGE